MTLIKRTNFPSLFSDRWLTDFIDTDRFFDSDLMKRMQMVPAVNVVEKNNEYEIELAAPGLDKKDFNITLENGVLTIACEKEEEKEEKDKSYTRQEYSYTNFERSFTLPENVKTDKLDARYENGVLRLVLPKTVETKVKAKEIPVH